MTALDILIRVWWAAVVAICATLNFGFIAGLVAEVIK